ncbi:hypothetical protein QFC22_003098 [Naganishia vaughanmartiniae]|uniref:Uncharacterized protein n=1 Tax=Naganishia vaughanmartiniae TaxID=1424756 RepID=A0ACC2X9B0_9TREE|nr:hypothetical protein QFC22_003098 [Naganishia vaughanmartiniae]
MKPSSDSKASNISQPPADASIPSDPPPAYTPTPDFPIAASGDSKSQPSITAAASVPSTATNSYKNDQPVLTPTVEPTPGRPLLHDGQCLVYKDGFYCQKCGNTGYKNDDPYHPCKSCWKKYGGPYTSALAHAWASPSSSTISSDSKRPPQSAPQQPPPQAYQRPLLLTHFRPSPAAAYTGIVMNHSYTRPGLIERGAQQNRVTPGQFLPQPPMAGPTAPPPATGNEKQGYGYAQGSTMPAQPVFGNPQQQFPGMPPPNGYVRPQGAPYATSGVSVSFLPSSKARET